MLPRVSGVPAYVMCAVCVCMPVSSWLVLARMHDSGGGVSSLALRPAVWCLFPLWVVPGVAACPGLPLLRAVTVDRFLGVVCSRCRLLSVGVRLLMPQ